MYGTTEHDRTRPEGFLPFKREDRIDRGIRLEVGLTVTPAWYGCVHPHHASFKAVSASLWGMARLTAPITRVRLYCVLCAQEDGLTTPLAGATDTIRSQ